MTQRVSLPYRAPVFVTVNIETGDVERVYMDDESVTLDTAMPIVSMDGEEMTPIDDPAIVRRALEVAEDVDWTSTDNRCQVWRGAYGGPGDIVEVLRAGLEHMLADDELPEPWQNSRGQVVTESSIRAALRFLDDSAVWESEQ